MDKKELQKAQYIIDALFYDDEALTQREHTLLENVISIAQTKLRQSDVSGSLQDRLFELANDFAVAKKGEVAVKLHTIHNGL
jgi:hypothetical protein